MAKGKFIDYITSDDPKKYPSDGVHTDGYYYKKVAKTTGSTTPIEPEPTLPDAVDGALTFYSEAPFRMCITNKKKNWDGTLYYSLDNSNWTEWNGEFIEGTNGIIYMRGVGNTYLNTSSISTKGAFHFETDTGCFMHCIGSMDDLLDYTTTPTMAEYCYYYMFSGCMSLATAPKLPATTLATYCYEWMFQGCTSLTIAPELPATTLAANCYSSLFQNCTNLTTAPKLPATTLASYCYSDMFRSCTSLTMAPELPATTLAANCYAYMFYGCTNLTTAPKLPATELTNYCYQYMFYDCTNLTTAPELPAITLTSSCYDYMFYNCTNLVVAPELPATTLDSYCYRKMFQYCTNLATAPELPATTLANSCYESMFYKCTNLTTPPELPATTLANSCYRSMFQNCTNIKLSSTQTEEYQTAYRIPTSGTGTTGSGSLSSMFSSTGGTFTGTPTINTTYYLSTSNTVV